MSISLLFKGGLFVNDIVEEFVAGKIRIYITKNDISKLRMLDDVIPIVFNSGARIDSHPMREYIEEDGCITLYTSENLRDTTNTNRVIFYEHYKEEGAISVDEFLNMVSIITIEHEEIESMFA